MLRAMNREREHLGITLVEIATEAAKTTRRRRGTCSISTVSSVFAGYTKSRNVLDAYERVKQARVSAA